MLQLRSESGSVSLPGSQGGLDQEPGQSGGGTSSLGVSQFHKLHAAMCAGYDWEESQRISHFDLQTLLDLYGVKT